MDVQLTNISSRLNPSSSSVKISIYLLNCRKKDDSASDRQLSTVRSIGFPLDSYVLFVSISYQYPVFVNLNKLQIYEYFDFIINRFPFSHLI